MFERLVVSFQRPVESFERLVVSFQRPVKSFERLVVSFQRPVESFERLVVSFQRPVESFERLVVSFQRPVESFQRARLVRWRFLDSTNGIEGFVLRASAAASGQRLQLDSLGAAAMVPRLSPTLQWGIV
jgi:hypothetical protein